MPSRAPRVCGHCGGTHQSGERCPKVAGMKRERDQRADAKRGTAKARGYDADWQRARSDFLAAYPSCARCGAKATLVDHVTSIRKAPERRLDRTNFMSLCTPCHSSWKQARERTNP